MVDINNMLGLPSTAQVGDFSQIAGEREQKAREWREQQPADFEWAHLVTEPAKIIFDAGSEITRGLASTFDLLGGSFKGQLMGASTDNEEEADRQIKDVREWLSSDETNLIGGLGIEFGKDTAAETKEGQFLGEFIGLVSPVIPAITYANRIGKALKWGIKKRLAAATAADALATFVIADPKDLYTFGNLIGGPTEIKPDDTAAVKKAKIAGEAIIIGGSLSIVGNKLFNSWANWYQRKHGRQPDIIMPKDTFEDDISLLKDGHVEKGPDGNIYTWHSGQWNNIKGQSPPRDSLYNLLTMKALNPDLSQKILLKENIGSMDIRPDRIVNFEMPPPISGVTVRSIGSHKYIWGVPGVKKGTIQRKIRTDAAYNKIGPRWIHIRTKDKGMDVTTYFKLFCW